MNFQSNSEIFEAFKKLNVIVVGDAMIDHYIYGNVDRTSPEAPVPVVLQEREEKRLGGAANVALNLRVLGANVSLFSIIGSDEIGDELKTLMVENQLKTEFIHIDQSRPTTQKTRIINGSEQVVRIDCEKDSPIDKALYERLIRDISTVIDSTEVLIFQDYDKGVLSESLIGHIINLCKVRDIPVVVDPKVKNYRSYYGATLFKPNLREVETSLGCKVNPQIITDLHRVFEIHRKLLNVETLLMTLSERGLFISDSTNQFLLPAENIASADVSGAGDTVVAVAALALALSLPLKTIGEWSNCAGGIVCRSAGVVPIDPDALLDEIGRLNKK